MKNVLDVMSKYFLLLMLNDSKWIVLCENIKFCFICRMMFVIFVFDKFYRFLWILRVIVSMLD